jgi:hypothetical protein
MNMSTYEARHGHPRTHYADGSRRRDQRREDAEARQAKRDARTPQQQLQLLDQKLGKNTGATKERLHLHSLITEQPPKKAERKTRRERKKARKA